VQAAGSALVDDPVLTATGTSPTNVKPVLCTADGPGRTTGTKRTVIRLPGDVLFAFGSAELTPAAREPIAAVDDEIGGGTAP